MSYDNATQTATLDPSGPLAAGTSYTARLAATIADVAGNTLQGAPLTWTFTTATTGGGTRIKDMTFEDGSLTHATSGADAINGTVALASPGLKGTYAASVGGANSYLTENFAGTDELYAVFYIQLNALPSSSVRLAQVLNGSTAVGTLLLTSGGRLRLRNDSTTIGADSAALSVGTLYRVAIHQRKGTGGNALLMEQVRGGALAWGFTDTDDYNVARTDGAPVEVVFPDADGIGTLFIPNTVCVLAAAPHPDVRAEHPPRGSGRRRRPPR